MPRFSGRMPCGGLCHKVPATADRHEVRQVRNGEEFGRFDMPRLYCFGLALAAWIAAGTSALAQDAAKYPEQMVRLVVPFSAGSMTDLLARTVADKLGERWKQQVIVENRPGLPGTSSVAKAAPGGSTLMRTSHGHTLIGRLNKKLT